MGNLLSHGLLAAAIAASANLVLGAEPVSWNVFLAAMVAVALNLDSGDGRIAQGSPMCHSLGCGILVIYLAGTVAYLAWAILGIGGQLAGATMLAVASGILAHLLAETAAGEQIFTFPGNLRPHTWLVSCDCDSERFWPAWGRFSLGRRRMKDVHLNAFSLATILASIALFQVF